MIQRRVPSTPSERAVAGRLPLPDLTRDANKFIDGLLEISIPVTETRREPS